MAILSDPNRVGLWADWMSGLSARHRSMPLRKGDLRAAVDAIDGWIDANAASFNSALPVAARTELTPKEKAELFVFVIRRRWEII